MEYKTCYHRYKKRRIFCEPRKIRFYVQAALLLGIILGIFLSAVFIRSAVKSPELLATQDEMLHDTQLYNASGDDILESSFIDPRLILGTELPVVHGVDLKEVYENGRIEADAPEGDIFFDVLPDDIKLEIIGFASDAPREFHIGAKGPQILIYHTHTQEAYRQIKGKEYVEAGSWRTAQHDASVVAVGRALKDELESYGYSVVHDTTNHEPPKLGTAYTRSLKTMQEYAKDYPAISVFIDVHRDAYGNIEQGSKDFVTVNGLQCARIMFVVGTGESFNDKPNYESNYKLALAVTNQLESIKKGFTRPIRVKTARYNQHVSDMCLLVEMGHNANSLEQALNSTRFVALALSRVLEPG